MIPIVTVDSEDEAIARANDSDFGLGASVWTGTAAAASGWRTGSLPGWW